MPLECNPSCSTSLFTLFPHGHPKCHIGLCLELDITLPCSSQSLGSVVVGRSASKATTTISGLRNDRTGTFASVEATASGCTVGVA